MPLNIDSRGKVTCLVLCSSSAWS